MAILTLKVKVAHVSTAETLAGYEIDLSVIRVPILVGRDEAKLPSSYTETDKVLEPDEHNVHFKTMRSTAHYKRKLRQCISEGLQKAET